MRIGRRTAPSSPLEPAGPTMEAIGRAEQAAAARLAAAEADRADIEAARRRAAELLAAASQRAGQLADQRRDAVRAELDAEVQREQAAGAAQIEHTRRAARSRHDRAVQLAVTFVLTGEAAE